jgi:hypothetical protein
MILTCPRSGFVPAGMGGTEGLILTGGKILFMGLDIVGCYALRASRVLESYSATTMVEIVGSIDSAVEIQSNQFHYAVGCTAGSVPVDCDHHRRLHSHPFQISFI